MTKIGGNVGDKSYISSFASNNADSLTWFRAPVGGTQSVQLPKPVRDDRWPFWKTALFVLLVCGAFWSAVVYAVVQLLD